jgi:hypothetical protein
MMSDPRSHELFSRYPDRAVTLRSGRQFAIPYHCYDADAFVLHGTVDLAATRALLQDENCQPAVLRRAGRPDRGIAQIWINLYRDTNYGPYRELVISFAASAEGQPRVFPHRSAASLLLPGLDPQCFVFTRWLYLDSQAAIDAGREVWGFPKYRAELSFDPIPSGSGWLSARTTLTHRTLTAEGKEVLRAHLVLEETRRARLAMAWQLLRALGLRNLLGRSSTGEGASTLLTPTLLKQVTTPVRSVGRPSLYPWTSESELSFGPETAGGRALAELRFEPALVHASMGMKFVMLGDDPRTLDPLATTEDVG